jgi:GT2 family glycosyltransferase
MPRVREGVTLLSPGENLGYGGGNNLGARLI